MVWVTEIHGHMITRSRKLKVKFVYPRTHNYDLSVGVPSLAQIFDLNDRCISSSSAQPSRLHQGPRTSSGQRAHEFEPSTRDSWRAKRCDFTEGVPRRPQNG